MNLLAPRALAGTPESTLAIARDIARIVVTAVLVGTAFALLLALTVLSLTVIAPPVQASGGPIVTSSESNPGDGMAPKGAGQVDAAPIQLAAAPVAAKSKPAEAPLDSMHDRVFEAQHKPETPVVLYLVLASIAGFLAFIFYSLMRRKS